MVKYNDESRRTPAEVAADAAIEHSGKGVFNAVKGTVRQAWGKITGNRRHQFGGKIDELKGRAQVGLGKLEAKEADLESRGDRDLNK
ncbi:MAG TPA: CsbD family protein [Vicinamibacterales bacterium]|nr:CsbD family protein [Vicinamibacterales bacterium]